MIKLFFGFNLVVMIGVTVWASLDQSVIAGFTYLFRNRWGVATLCDTYFAFLTIFLWMASREKSSLRRGLWFLFVMTWGSIATSIYLLVHGAEGESKK